MRLFVVWVTLECSDVNCVNHSLVLFRTVSLALTQLDTIWYPHWFNNRYIDTAKQYQVQSISMVLGMYCCHDPMWRDEAFLSFSVIWNNAFSPAETDCVLRELNKKFETDALCMPYECASTCFVTVVVVKGMCSSRSGCYLSHFWYWSWDILRL